MKKIIEIIKREQAREQRDADLVDRVRAALVPFVGKDITKRLATAVEKALGENYRVYYKVGGYGCFTEAEMSVALVDQRGETVHKIDVKLGKPSAAFTLGDIVAYAENYRAEGARGFDTDNAPYCHYAKERNESRAELLANPAALARIAAAVEAVNAAEAEYKAATEDVHEEYLIRSLLDTEEGKKARRFLEAK